MGQVLKSYKEESRKNWGKKVDENIKPTNEELLLGANLRMADALEDIAKDKRDLLRELESVKMHRDNLRELYAEESRRVTALKGVITRMKNKMKK